jgi:hypothetical protein
LTVAARRLADDTIEALTREGVNIALVDDRVRFHSTKIPSHQTRALLERRGDLVEARMLGAIACNQAGWGRSARMMRQ